MQLIWDRDCLNHNPKAAATREFFFLIWCPLSHLLEETISSPVSNQEVAPSDTQSFSPKQSQWELWCREFTTWEVIWDAQEGSREGGSPVLGVAGRGWILLGTSEKPDGQASRVENLKHLETSCWGGVATSKMMEKPKEEKKRGSGTWCGKLSVGWKQSTDGNWYRERGKLLLSPKCRYRHPASSGGS